MNASKTASRAKPRKAKAPRAPRTIPLLEQIRASRAIYDRALANVERLSDAELLNLFGSGDEQLARVVARLSGAQLARVVARLGDVQLARVVARLGDAQLARVVARLGGAHFARVVAWLGGAQLDRVVAWLGGAQFARVVAWLGDAQLDRVVARLGDVQLARVAARLGDAQLARVVARLGDAQLARVVVWLGDAQLDRVIARLGDAQLDRVVARLGGAQLARVVAWLGDAQLARVVARLNLRVPVVENLDQRMAEHALAGKLDMSKWHCGTTHCRAGWAITLAGDAGKTLEKAVGPEVAGRYIYEASTGRPAPDFFANTEDAKADILHCAQMAMTP